VNHNKFATPFVLCFRIIHPICLAISEANVNFTIQIILEKQHFVIMKTLTLDTRPEAEKVLISLLRSANTAQKFAKICSLSQTVIQLSKRAIARANPGLSEEQIELRFIALQHGKELAYNVEKFLENHR